MKKPTTFSRRDFLHGACILGAGAGLAAFAGPLLPLKALAAPGAPGTEQQTRLLMGTMVTLTAVTKDPAKAEAAFAAAFDEVRRLIAVFDRRDPASALFALNDAGRLKDAPEELCAVLGESARLGSVTAHAFNPAIAPLLELYERHKNDKEAPRFDDRDMAEALALAEPSALRVEGGLVSLERKGMRLTLDGIAKGFIADAASRALSEHGLRDHMVNAGGDMRVRGLSAGNRPWSVGIQHPDDRGALLAKTALTGGGIATSGNYEQPHNASRTRNHLISHQTGRCSEAASVTVKAPSAMQADALATALAVMAPTLAVACIEKHTAASCLIVDRHGRRFASRGWS